MGLTLAFILFTPTTELRVHCDPAKTRAVATQLNAGIVDDCVVLRSFPAAIGRIGQIDGVRSVTYFRDSRQVETFFRGPMPAPRD